MKYMGSKARIVKDILPIILSERNPNQWYFEPFAGGMNVICEVDGKRIANDKNEYLIEMWKGLQKGNKYPTEISKDLYDYARGVFRGTEEETLEKDLVGWIGWMASANGRFFDGGYSGISSTKIGTERNYIQEAINNINKQLKNIDGIIFTSKCYTDFELKEPCLIYCDPPYQGTKQYSSSKDFNHDLFWNWCRQMKNIGHTVFVSEYNAPDDFNCVWQKELSSSLRANSEISGSKKSIEKLFKI